MAAVGGVQFEVSGSPCFEAHVVASPLRVTTGEVQFTVSDLLYIYLQGVTNTPWAIAMTDMVKFTVYESLFSNVLATNNTLRAMATTSIVLLVVLESLPFYMLGDTSPLRAMAIYGCVQSLYFYARGVSKTVQAMAAIIAVQPEVFKSPYLYAQGATNTLRVMATTSGVRPEVLKTLYFYAQGATYTLRAMAATGGVRVHLLGSLHLCTRWRLQHAAGHRCGRRGPARGLQVAVQSTRRAPATRGGPWQRPAVSSSTSSSRGTTARGGASDTRRAMAAVGGVRLVDFKSLYLNAQGATYTLRAMAATGCVQLRVVESLCLLAQCRLHRAAGHGHDRGGPACGHRLAVLLRAGRHQHAAGQGRDWRCSG